MAKFTLTAMKYDEISESGNMYSRDTLLDIITNFNADTNLKFGELNDGSNTSSVVNLKNVSHSVTNLTLDDTTKSLMCEIEIVHTDAGNRVNNIWQVANKPFNEVFTIKPRGTGIRNSETSEITDYTLISFDVIPI